MIGVVEDGGGTSSGKAPNLVLVDTQGQVMARHAEMIGLNESCAHLAECLLLASLEGHRTVGYEYGKAAAGAFLATALATDVLVAIEGAAPAVMDLLSIAWVMKRPEEKPAAMDKTTPVFAPGLDPRFKTGAVTALWDAGKPLAAQFAKTPAGAGSQDVRGKLGHERGGRTMSAVVARRVMEAVGGSAEA